MTSELEIKTERLCRLLEAENLGGVLLGAQHNFAWLTGGRSNAVNTATEAGASFLLVGCDGRRFVLASNIEMPRLLREEIAAADFEPVEFSWTEEKASGDFVLRLAERLFKNGGAAAADLFLCNAGRVIENRIASCRYSLTAEEIERYRRLGRDAGAALGEALTNDVAPGESETEIAEKIRRRLAARGIAALVALVGADERIELFRHPLPTAKRWEKVLLAAVCARREGLVANLSRIVCAGPVPPELASKTEAAARVFARLLAATRAGATGAELYRAAREGYAENDLADEIGRHHQGGATGYKTREWIAHPASAETVRDDQAFAWNPTVTGTKIEETCIVIDGAPEIITATPGFPRLSVAAGGEQFTASGILSL